MQIQSCLNVFLVVILINLESRIHVHSPPVLQLLQKLLFYLQIIAICFNFPITLIISELLLVKQHFLAPMFHIKSCLVRQTPFLFTGRPSNMNHLQEGVDTSQISDQLCVCVCLCVSVVSLTQLCCCAGGPVEM